MNIGSLLWILTLVQGVASAWSEPGPCVSAVQGGGAVDRMQRCNVVWTSPSVDATRVMPIGNGDMAYGAYALEDGDFNPHLEGRTTIRGKVTDGKLVEWGIQPASRMADVVVFAPHPTLEKGETRK